MPWRGISWKAFRSIEEALYAQADPPLSRGIWRQRKSPALGRASGYFCLHLRMAPERHPGVRRALVLHVQLGATVLRAAFRIVRTIRVGVRRDRAALAVTVRTDHARGVDAVAGQVVVHR